MRSLGVRRAQRDLGACTVSTSAFAVQLAGEFLRSLGRLNTWRFSFFMENIDVELFRARGQDFIRSAQSALRSPGVCLPRRSSSAARSPGVRPGRSQCSFAAVYACPGSCSPQVLLAPGLSPGLRGSGVPGFWGALTAVHSGQSHGVPVPPPFALPGKCAVIITRK